MNNPLEISGKDISDLNDSDLRELIGLLCEADCKASGQSPIGVTWGGHQDAKDGGIDVFVSIPNPIKNSSIRRYKNGFQVKKPKMTASSILIEMRPNGVLRESIRSLIEASGGYIIICSSESTSDGALKNRLTAMEKAVIDEPNYTNLYLDFYDQGRIATWVRTHPSLILWVQRRVGRFSTGWQPYENWSRPGKALGEYLVDNGTRLFNGTDKSKAKAKEAEISIEEGLNKIRQILARPGTSVRLTGLSGVGKTRFIQALFEDGIGINPLNSSQVFYTDISNGPEPNPRMFAEQLKALQTRSFLIIDNCPPDLHRTLTAICTGDKSTISLLTVEYDVREDLPEETEVFRLEPASEELIAKLVRLRYEHIGEVDANRIAHFSGGNARIAIALANTVKQGETLSGFKDDDLFNRLFTQRKKVDPKLIRSGEVLSLVYSFEGTKTDSSSELDILGSLISRSASDLYRDVAELTSRDLVQNRHIWRAVLPHAIANQLAKQALKFISLTAVESVFNREISERLLKSFTRRISFLHDSEEAISLVNRWIERGGWLADFGRLDDLEITIVENIAPVSPQKILEALERSVYKPGFFSQSNNHQRRFISLLRSLAYDQELFSKSVQLLIKFIFAEDGSDRNNGARAELKSLFLLLFSGTHAPIEVRFERINELITDPTISQQQLGIQLLDAALKAENFSSHHYFDFGARPRDFGYTPKTDEDIANWYGFLINQCVEIILQPQAVSNKIKELLADKFRGLWAIDQVRNDLLDAAKKIRQVGPWLEGWIEVRTAMYFSKEDGVDEDLTRLSELLQPTNLIEKIRIYGLASNGTYYEFIEDEDEGNPTASQSRGKRIDQITLDLAIELAQDELSLASLLPELVSKPAIRTWLIGRGLAYGSTNKMILWNKLRDQLAVTNETCRCIDVLNGFLFELSQIDPVLSCQLLDEILTDSVLNQWLPNFQASVPINQKGVTRLLYALEKNIAPIRTYAYLFNSLQFRPIDDHNLAFLLEKIMSISGGDDVASEILYDRIKIGSDNELAAELITVGRAILVNYNYAEHRDNRLMDRHLSIIAKFCLVGPEAVESVIPISKNLLNAYRSYDLSASDFDDYLAVIGELHPTIFLDIFVCSDPLQDNQLRNLFTYYLEKNKSVFSKISDETILSWCKIMPHIRYRRVSYLMNLFDYNHKKESLEWKPIAIAILEQAPNVDEILEAFSFSLPRNPGISSRIESLYQRFPLLNSLLHHTNPNVSTWAKKLHTALQTEIEQEREFENERSHWRNESFE